MLTLFNDSHRLRGQLQYLARRVPAYGELLKRAEDPNVEAEALLESWPTVTKRDLVERGEALFALEMRSAALICQTSGTTGGPVLVTPRSQEELRWNSANVAKAFARHLVRGRDRVALLNPCVMSPYSEACGLALMSIGVPFVRVFPIAKIMTYEGMRQILRDYDANVVMTTSTLANKAAYEWGRLGGVGTSRPLKFLLTGELLTNASLANTARLVDGSAAAFVYGSSESATCAIGCANNRYHPCLEDFAFEIDPAAGGGSPDTGELIVTWLNAGIRPLARYRTGDLVTVKDGCECDHPGVAFEVHGRVDASSMSARDRAALDEIVFAWSAPIYHYDLILGFKREGAALTVITGQPGEAPPRALPTELAEAVHGRLGIRVNVNANPAGHEFFDFAPMTKTARVTTVA